MFTIILLLLGSLILLLAIPVQIIFRIQGVDNFTKELMICGLFGLLRVRVPLKKSIKGNSSKHSDDNSRGRSWFRINRQRKSDASFTTGISPGSLFRLAKHVLNTLHFRELVLQMRLGLGDPADTGRLWAWIGPLNATMQTVRNWQINIEPDFMNTIIDFNLHGRVVFIPLKTAAVLAVALLAPSVLLDNRFSEGLRDG